MIIRRINFFSEITTNADFLEKAVCDILISDFQIYCVNWKPKRFTGIFLYQPPKQSYFKTSNAESDDDVIFLNFSYSN